MSRAAVWGELPARLSLCSTCQKQFEPGDEYVSELKGDPHRGYTRSDYCQHCWQAAPKEKKLSHARGNWRARVPLREKNQTEQAPKIWSEHALRWLKQHINDPSADQPAMFVLAMLLVREKILILRQEIQGLAEERLQLYEIAATEELLAIPKLQASKLPFNEIYERLKPIFVA